MVCYSIFVFSPLPFFARCRALYIETAMSTKTHQWLATAFIPDCIVESVMENAEKQFDSNMVYESGISSLFNHGASHLFNGGMTPDEKLLARFPEIDPMTLPGDLEITEDLQISDILDLGIRTTVGDSVYAIDMPNGILILQIEENGYVGKLVIVKDSSQVELAVLQTDTGRGRTVTEFCEETGAVLGINGGGFGDEGGEGMGNLPIGLVIQDGKIVNEAVSDGYFQIAGYDYDNNFRVGYGLDTRQLRDAVQFYPVVVLNGEKCTEGTSGLGLQPRTVIGQSADGATLMLVIDGRQVGYSIGATMDDCADILLRYGAYNAMNMDGGSSSSITYMGKMITKVSTRMEGGRYLPNAWVVMPGEPAAE